MFDTISGYVKKAEQVLASNWRGVYTVPSSSLYPHQWNWDSGFIAIGYSHYNTERAMKEISSLLDAQWKNGLVPQIVFNKDVLGNYFPEPDFWRTDLSPHSPDNHLTSGITMPPILAYSVLKIYENAEEKEKVLPFLKHVYGALLSFHRYLYNERDIKGDGLIYIRHPWESGMDNSPAWDGVLERIDLSSIDLPDYERKDTSSGVSAHMRPTKKYYDYFVYLMEIFKKARYSEKEIRNDCPFLICGPLFNAVLCASNEALIRISDIINEPYREIEEWYEKTSSAVRERLYNEERGIFEAYDHGSDSLLELDTASGFVPLFGGAPSREQADRIYQYLDSKGFCALHQGNCYTIPSYDTGKEDFKRENYWRGPVWININWMLVQGLRRYGFIQRADSLSRDILELPIRFGFYEYFDSFDGRGYGSNNFSWTASLFIDTAYETYIKTGRKSILEKVPRVLIRNHVLNSTESSKEYSGSSIAREMMNAIKEIKKQFYTDRGTVDYESIRSSKEYMEYKGIAAALQDFDLEILKDEKEKTAFWINLYNTIVVDAIIATGIKESVKEVAGFFSRLKYNVGGHLFSPDDIEHGILRANRRKPSGLRKQFGPFNKKNSYALKELDPRIHFALVCASRSCAPIKYYTAGGIDEELERAAKNFINSSEVIVIPEEKRLLMSQIFLWYERDFDGRSGMLEFICKYIIDDDKREFIREDSGKLDVSYLYYDWNLNN